MSLSDVAQHSKTGVDYLGKKMTEEEKLQWDTLYQYVKREILHYDDNQSIPTSLVLRLKGLSNGKLMANNKIEDKANYNYDVVLKAFQICKVNILNSTRGKNFDSETYKFNYICKIVENSLNDVYQRLQTVKKTKEKIEAVDTNALYHNGAEYVTSEKKTNSKLKDLW